MANGVIIPTNTAVIYDDFEFNNVAIDTLAGSIYYKGGFNVKKTGYTPISCNIVNFSNLADTVIPYVSRDNETVGFISKTSISATFLIVRVAYVKA